MNPTEGNLQIDKASPFFGPDGFSGVGVLDTATGRYATIFRTEQCRCAQLPVFLNGGSAVSFGVDVADPGGSTVDVVFAGFQPVRNVQVEGDGEPASDPEVTELKPRSLALLSRTEQGAVGVQGDKQVSLDTDVLFAFGSADLSPAAGADLDRAAAALKEQPGRRLGVFGHTDSKGDDAFNQGLSDRRAQTVRDALAPRLGDGWTFEVRGFGETQPVTPETSQDGRPNPEGQARNRRVQLTVLS
ncbi:MAG: OmpA family protein [Actinobacteria bacterium]|nr:OmpA family protein [Actinomycetota bacterium]